MSSFALKKHPSFKPRKGPVMLCVMDGIGLGKPNEGNAVHLAHTPTLDWLMSSCLWTQLRAHGTAVGLPSDDDMGNSEVGHNALGAGSVFDQGSKLVTAAITSGALFEGETWREIVEQVAGGDRTLHLIGLLSDGNVHSHIDQVFALVRRAHQDGIKKLRVHPLLDGRDVPETSAMKYIEPLEALLEEMSRAGCDYRIASGGGRMLVTMDRYNANWSVVKRGWEAHVHGNGRRFPSASAAIETYRKEKPGLPDQDMPEWVIEQNGEPVGKLRDGDAVVFFNFRGDRAIELSRAFDEDDFHEFDRGERPKVLYAGMMQYDGDLHIPKKFLVSPPSIERTIGEFLARNSIPQLAISETQKYGHVTYFWNGNRGGMFDEKLESYVCVDSDLRPFNERPWMKAAEVTDRFIDELASGKYRHLRLNYANGDMVGHTGDFDATRLAVETVDLCLKRLLEATRKADGILVITADHGNADEMFELDKKGAFQRDAQGRPRPKTAHTLNPVPLIIFDPSYANEYELAKVDKPGLSNVAATLFSLMGFEPPKGFDPALVRFRTGG